MATAGGGNDMAEGAIRFFLSLRSLGCTVLAIDHIASEDLKGKGGSKKPFGSVFKVNAARNTFEVELVDSPSGSHRLVMRHRKTNVGARLDDRYYELTWGPDSVAIDHVTYTPTAVTPLSLRITNALVTGPMTVEKLVEVVSADGEGDVSEVDVRTTLRPLLYDHDIRIEDGKVMLDVEVP
jgi:hypothetical protein